MKLMTQIHQLKTWPEYFSAVLSGEKTFEVRKNDRDFEKGDILELHYYDPDNVFCSRIAKAILKEVSYVLPGGNFGIEEGYCVLGLKEHTNA